MFPGLDWSIFNLGALLRCFQGSVSPESVAVVNILLPLWHQFYQTNGQGSRCVYPKGLVSIIVSDLVVLIA